MCSSDLFHGRTDSLLQRKRLCNHDTGTKTLLSRDLEVLGDPEPIPAGRERGLEAVGVHLVHDVAEHLDETAVAVEGEAPVV